VKTLIGYIAVGIIRIMGLQSYSFAHKFGGLIGKFLWARKTRAREVAKVNVAKCFPEKSKAEQEEFVRQALLEGGKTMTEVGLIWGWSVEKAKGLIKDTVGEEVIDGAIAEGKGVIYMALHHGNWEILNHAMHGKGKILGLYKPAKMPPFDNWMYKSRARLNLGLVPTTKEGVQELYKALERNEIIAYLPDQEPSQKSGAFAPFFGVPALTPKLPFDLIQKTGARVVFSFAERLEDGSGFRIHYKAAEPEIYSDDLLTSQTSMNKTIEECIRICPTQFEWSYKRFKRQPEGQRNPYRDCP